MKPKAGLFISEAYWSDNRMATRLHPTDRRHNNKQSKTSRSSLRCRSRRLNRGLGWLSKKAHRLKLEEKNELICTVHLGEVLGATLYTQASGS
jgi:hypothetical protein